MARPKIKNTGRYDILIVDDTPDSLEFLGRILDEQGYRVRPAPNGSLALEAVAARVPDLVLLDVKMPEMDGYEVCRRLKSSQHSKNVPVIFISAFGETAKKVKGFKAGGVDYISKPFEREEVLARVEIHLRLSKMAEDLENEVSLRTMELTLANRQLQEEIAERRQAAEAMKVNEERYRMAQAIGRVGNWEYIIGTNEIWASDEARRIFAIEGHSDRFSSEEFERFIIGREWVHQALVDLIENGEPFELEFEIETTNSPQATIISSIAELQRDERGEPSKVVGVIQDITDRKRAEIALKHSEREKGILNEIANIFLTISDEAIFGEVLEVVLKAVESKYGIFGYLSENGDLVLPSMTREVWDECTVSDKSIVFPAGSWGNSLWGRSLLEKKSFVSDGPFRIPAGHIAIEHFLTVPIVYGNQSIGVISVANKEQSYTDDDKAILEKITAYISPILNARLQRDRQEQKRKSVEQSLQKLSHAVEQSPVAIVISDTAGHIEYVNPKFMEQTGYSEKESFGRKLNILQEGALPDDASKEVWESITSGKQWRGEFQNKKKSGVLYWVSASLSPIFNAEGAICNFVGVFEDVTEKKLLEEHFRQMQKLEAVGTLAGGIAHDFNNILGGIIGYAQLGLLQTYEGSDIQKSLRQLLKATSRARELVKQILSFSRPEAKKKQLVDLDLLVRETLKLIRASAPATIEIKRTCLAEEPWVLAAPSQLHQVLINLCTNACHAMTEQGGTMEVTIEEKSLGKEAPGIQEPIEPGHYICLTVRDSGYGMEKEVRDRIFEPYFTTKEKEKGTGLGLSVVHGIVRDHGGIIKVESAPGKGSAFHVCLPASSKRGESLQEKPSPLARGNEKILFVDDEPLIVDATKSLLEHLGFSVTGLTKPEEAMAMLEANPSMFDLVITDQTMPKWTGAKLGTRLRSLCPEMPIIICSGFSESMNAKKAASMGFQAFLSKPLTIEKLSTTVRKVLDQSKGPAKAQKESKD